MVFKRIRVRSYKRNGRRVRSHHRNIVVRRGRSRRLEDLPRLRRKIEYYPANQYSYVDQVRKINEQIADIMLDPSLTDEEKMEYKEVLEHVRKTMTSQIYQKDKEGKLDIYRHRRRRE